MESLKEENGGDTPLFRLVDLSDNEQAGRIKDLEVKMSLSERERHRIMVTEFFTGVMPFVMYVVFKNKWCRYFNISPEELRICFDHAMLETHEQYHLKRSNKTF